MKAECIGEGNAQFLNVNVAWETGKTVDEINRENNTLSDLGNNEYKRACDELLFPMVREFGPDVILISCGFDGAVHDPLGWSNISPMMYGYMTNQLNKICPKIMVIQEGGYNVDYLGQHASGVARALI
jgi:acetoin utilization deacetylase AcuC-like enzyme